MRGPRGKVEDLDPAVAESSALCVHYVHPLDLIWWKFYVDYNRVGQVLMYISMVLSLWCGCLLQGILEHARARSPQPRPQRFGRSCRQGRGAKKNLGQKL